MSTPVRGTRDRLRGPSGPEAVRWWLRMARQPLETYASLRARYGTAVRVPYARHRAVHLLTGAQYAEHVLVSHQDNYAKAFTYRPLRAFLGDGLLTSEGEVWRRHRRLVQPVFAQRQLGHFGDDIVERTRAMTSAWTDGAVVDGAAESRRLTLDIVGRALFGIDLASDAEATGRSVATLQRGVMVGIMTSLLPGRVEGVMTRAIRSTPGLGAAGGQLDDLVRRVIAERQLADRGDAPPDLLDLLIAAGDEGDDRLDQRELRDEVMTLMLAGHETTAAALTWTWCRLSRHPEARSRLEEEVDEVLGGRPASADDLDRLPWTRAVLEESMRLHPPAWTIERDATCDDDIAGVQVGPGDTVVISPYLLHRDPEVWPNPEGFDPGRFLGDHDRPRHSYLPFGGGRRICVGAGFAMLEAVLVLASVAATHRLDLVPGAQVRAAAGITLRPAGVVPMTVRRRDR